MNTMKLWLGESDGRSFFLSVATVEKDDFLSFDWTYKGHRIVLQRRTAVDDEPPVGRQPDGSWYVLVVEAGRLVGKEREVWYDFDENDLVNGENWKAVQEWPLAKDVAVRMREIARLITQHQADLSVIQDDIKEMEAICRREAERVGVKLLGE